MLVHIAIAGLYLLVLVSTAVALMLIGRKDYQDAGLTRDNRKEGK